jgi:hypothetical protein
MAGSVCSRPPLTPDPDRTGPRIKSPLLRTVSYQEAWLGTDRFSETACCAHRTSLVNC